MHEAQTAIQLLIFDLDGTTADTLCGITLAINRALSSCGLPTHTEEGVRRFVNYGTSQFVAESLPTDRREDAALREQITERYLAAYADTYIETRAYPGLPELLTRLSAHTLLAINTNKQHEFAMPLTERLYAPNTFFAVEGFRADRPGKPDPVVPLDILHRASERLETSLSPANCMYIGDSDVDVATARNAGMCPVSVSWGYRSYEFLRGLGDQPIARTVEELEHILAEGGVKLS